MELAEEIEHEAVALYALVRRAVHRGRYNDRDIWIHVALVDMELGKIHGFIGLAVCPFGIDV